MLDLRGKRVVMTGATGFIGRNVARRFLEGGAEVFCLVRPDSQNCAALENAAGDCSAARQKNLHIIAGTMEDAEVVCAAQVGSADLFLHFAWRGVNRGEIDSPAVQQINIEDSLRCVRAAIDLGCQVFMDAGSRVEYGIMPDGRMEETMECRPVNAYGKAKLAFFHEAEPLLHKAGITYYHLRYFSVYGRGDHPWSIISTLTRDLPMGKTVSLSACRHRWNFMDIEDASRAVAELYRYSDGHAGECHIVNVASEDTRVLRDFVEEIDALCGHKGALEFGTFVQAKEGALSIRPVMERLKILTDGTWRERVSFADGIRRMLEEREST